MYGNDVSYPQFVRKMLAFYCLISMELRPTLAHWVRTVSKAQHQTPDNKFGALTKQVFLSFLSPKVTQNEFE